MLRSPPLLGLPMLKARPVRLAASASCMLAATVPSALGHQPPLPLLLWPFSSFGSLRSFLSLSCSLFT